MYNIHKSGFLNTSTGLNNPFQGRISFSENQQTHSIDVKNASAASMLKLPIKLSPCSLSILEFSGIKKHISSSTFVGEFEVSGDSLEKNTAKNIYIYILDPLAYHISEGFLRGVLEVILEL